jgi:hypothetical protein
VIEIILVYEACPAAPATCVKKEWRTTFIGLPKYGYLLYVSLAYVCCLIKLIRLTLVLRPVFWQAAVVRSLYLFSLRSCLFNHMIQQAAGLKFILGVPWAIARYL